MTVHEVSRLTGVTVRALQYYDRIGLLAPAKVDEWTGYRYYEEDQAMRFVKIKNLQQADFSIEEIRPLLEENEDRLAEAFERKIEEQQQKLERIRKIQRSYLKETMDMQNMIRTITDFVEGRMGDPKLWKEFGLDDAQETEISARVHEMLADWLTEIRNASGEIAQSMAREEANVMKTVMDAMANNNPEGKDLIMAAAKDDNQAMGNEIPADAEKVFERSGWEHISDWLAEVPDLSDGKQNFFEFKVRDDSPVNDGGFPTLALAVMAAKFGAMNGGMTCNAGRSADGINHFTLYRK
jgi:DNA-binding transcriptional MerR regulator